MPRTYLLRTVLMWTLLELLAALQVPTVGGSPILFSWLRTVIEPVAMVAQGTVDLAVDLGLGARGLQRAIVENREMRIELETLRARQILLQADLAALREIGDFAGSQCRVRRRSSRWSLHYRDLIAGTMEIGLHGLASWRTTRRSFRLGDWSGGSSEAMGVGTGSNFSPMPPLRSQCKLRRARPRPRAGHR